MKKLLLISATVFSFSNIACAAPYGEKDLKPTLDGKNLIFPQLNLSSPERCRDSVDLGAMKNSQWAICDKLELNILDASLNSSYQLLRKKLDKEQKEILTKGQKSWLNFREEWCLFEQVGPSQGPMGEARYTSCLIEMTEKQINRLNRLLKYHPRQRGSAAPVGHLTDLHFAF